LDIEAQDMYMYEYLHLWDFINFSCLSSFG